MSAVWSVTETEPVVTVSVPALFTPWIPICPVVVTVRSAKVAEPELFW